MIAPDLDLARRFLEAHAAREPLLAAVTGSHLYGFPSADSDLDLKGVHVAPTAMIVSLDPPPSSVDFPGVFEGTEVDYTSHELGRAFQLLLKGSGNLLERFLSPLQAIPPPEELQALARGSVSRRFYRHYRGFLATQRGLAAKEAAATGKPTAKRLLYCYRSALTGIHLLSTGECLAEVGALAERYGFPRVGPLIAIKTGGGEHEAAEDHALCEADFARLEAMLEEAFRKSALPESAPNVAALSEYLVAERRRRF